MLRYLLFDTTECNVEGSTNYTFLVSGLSLYESQYSTAASLHPDSVHGTGINFIDLRKPSSPLYGTKDVRQTFYCTIASNSLM